MPLEIHEDKPVDVCWRPIAGVVALLLAVFQLTVVVAVLVHRGFADVGIRVLVSNGFIIYFFASFGAKWLRNETLK